MSKAISQAAAALGKKGGKAGTGAAKKRSAEHYRLAGIKSGEARRKRRAAALDNLPAAP